MVEQLPFRWKRFYVIGGTGYFYSCAPEMHRSSALVTRRDAGWCYHTRRFWSPTYWKTAKLAKLAAELHLSG